MIILGQKCDGVVDNITNNASTTKLWNTFLGLLLSNILKTKLLTKDNYTPILQTAVLTKPSNLQNKI